MVSEAAATLPPSLPSHVKLNIVVLESDIYIFGQGAGSRISPCVLQLRIYLVTTPLTPSSFKQKNDIIELVWDDS